MIDFGKEEKEFKNIPAKFEEELKKIRAGRASAAMLENIEIDAYGAQTRLSHAAAFSSLDPKSVVVRPWDRNLLPAIESALGKAALGFSIISEKDQIRVVFPALTEERRKEFVKLVNKKSEEARIEIRKKRDDVWKTIQEEERAKLISETQKYSQKDKMEKIVEEANKKIAEAAVKKEKEIMEI